MGIVKREPCKTCGGPKGPGRGIRYCPPCALKRDDARSHRGRGVRGLSLLPRYQITVEQYDELLKQQGGVCALCGTVQPPVKGRVLHFAVDHDHATGVNRGLLCLRCNTGLHYIENAEWRLRAEAYLLRHCEPILAAVS
jgi:hypothetical protein